jgi:plasmid stabilization system protein ParE
LERSYTVSLHPAARRDLLRIADGLAAHSGRDVAERKLADFAEAMRRLSLTPHKGSIRHEIAPGLRAIPAAGCGVVAFVVDDDARAVRVVAIGYGGSDWLGRAARRR